MTQPQPARDPAAVLTAALRRHPYLLLAAACLPFAALNRPNGVDPSLFASLVLLLGVTAFLRLSRVPRVPATVPARSPRRIRTALRRFYAEPLFRGCCSFPTPIPGLSVAATGPARRAGCR